MDPILLQKQVRDNAEDLQNSLKDLKNWESEMKRRESELCSASHSVLEQSASRNSEMPPIRNKIRKSEKKTRCEKDNTTVKCNKISGFDYASWDKFDVEKACQQLDADSESDEDTESDGSDIETQRLRDEAMYEKEKGNQFVKNQKWTNAIECYTRAIERYPYDAVFFANRALCHLKLSDLKSAETDCTAAINLDITYVKAFHRRAAARTGLGLLEEAKGDLEKVLMFEPKNSVAKAEILKIEKKINALQTEKKSLIEREKNEEKVELPQVASSSVQKAVSSNESLLGSVSNNLSSARENTIITSASQENKPQPTTSLQKAGSSDEPLSRGGSNNSSTEKVKTTCASASHENKPQSALQCADISEDKGVIVYPIHKPPHLRSKVPLKEVKIKVINEGMPTKPVVLSQLMGYNSISEGQASASGDLGVVSGDLGVAPRTQIATDIQKVLPTTIPDKEDDISSIPPPPATYIDFYVGWNKVHQSFQRRFLYLKQIPAADLPRIFGESLESSVLSELIETLERSFLPSKEPVYPYLLGISNVKRVSTLSLFLSKADKTRLEALLDGCEHLGECIKDEVLLLRKKYEL